jgi:putative Ca2+/H+ antiporter (TMEM165/GDT1 family)
MQHKGQVIAGVVAANLIMDFCVTWVLGPGVQGWQGIAVPVCFTSIATILMLARQRWSAALALGAMLSLYVLFRFI